MKLILINNLKVILIFLAVSLVSGIFIGALEAFTSRNLVVGRILIAIYTLAIWILYFTAGKIILKPQNSILTNILSTILILVITIVLFAMKSQLIAALALPSYLITGILKPWIDQRLSIALHVIISWLSVILGMLSKTWGK